MKKLIAILTIFSLVFYSCETDLDINIDPDAPTGVDKKFFLTAGEASLATILGGQLTNLGGFMAQYHTQSPSASQYLNIDTYNMNADYSNRSWNELYAGCLNDLNYVSVTAEAEGDTGSYMIAALLKAYTFQVLTDLYGPIPYSETLLGAENITPKLDSGSDVYAGLIADVTDAMAKYAATPVASTVGAQDAIYDADMSKWTQFGNTLLLKMYMRMSYTTSANPSAVQALLTKDNFISENAKVAIYDAGENKANPFYDVQLDHLGDVNNVASSSLLQFYDTNIDPRIAKVFRIAGNSTYRGLDQGDRGSVASEQAKDFSRPNVLETTPVYLMTVAESNFLQAEALIRYSSGTGAVDKYNAGIASSFETYGLTATQAQVLTGTGGAYEYVASANVETAVRQVMIQKWASLAYINNIEAFFELNRTGYPEIVTKGNEDYKAGNLIVAIESVIPGNLTPKTILYPDDEVDRNPNVTQKGALTEKIWWDLK